MCPQVLIQVWIVPRGVGSVRSLGSAHLSGKLDGVSQSDHEKVETVSSVDAKEAREALALESP